MKKARSVLLHNFGLKIVSILLAVILWFVVAQIDDPQETVRFNNVQVRLTNTELLEQENKVYEVLDNSNVVRVTIRAPKSVTDTLSVSDIIAEADLSKLTEINTVPISFSLVTDDNVDSISGSRDSVQLSIEEKATKNVSVSANPIGEVADGYLLGSISMDQNRIEISGPQSAVSRVSRALANIDISDASSSISANVDISLYDSEGNLVTDSIVLQTESVHVNVAILETKTVPVYIAGRTGEPADGYLYDGGNVSISPAVVRIAGSASALSGVSRVTYAELIDISGAEEDIVQTVNITDYLPPNTSFADSGFDGRVEVTLPIVAMSHRTISVPISSIVLTGLPEDLELQLVGASAITLQIGGVEEDVNALEESAVTGVVDIGAWMEGEGLEALSVGESYEVPVAYSLPDGITVLSSSQVLVQTVIPEEGEDGGENG